MHAQSVFSSIRLFHDDLTAIRQDIHANPELGFQEVRTSTMVARMLTALGYQVHRDIGKPVLWACLKGGATPAVKA